MRKAKWHMGCQNLWLQVASKAEVSNLQHSIWPVPRQQEILWLQITLHMADPTGQQQAQHAE